LEGDKNMRDVLVRKVLVIGIIVLFIGIGVYPAIAENLSTSTNENISDKLVKVPVQIFGHNGFKSYKLSITKQQYDDFQVLKEKFKKDFEKADTMKKSVVVYRNMVLSLDKLGLLPEGMSIVEAEKLVLGPYYYLDKLGLLSDKKFVDDSQQNPEKIDHYYNSHCQLTWDSSNWWSYIWLPDYDYFGVILQILGIFFNKIAFGVNYGTLPDEPPDNPSVGWIHARSSQHEWVYNGTFWGGIGITDEPFGVYYFKGVNGFFGYRVDGYIFGNAKTVHIKTL
jgi:hypothetical protein